MADTEPEVARDAGPFTTDEALKALDYHMALAARRSNDSLHADLEKIRELIEAQQECIDDLRKAGGELFRRMRGNIESLSRKPT